MIGQVAGHVAIIEVRDARKRPELGAGRHDSLREAAAGEHDDAVPAADEVTSSTQHRRDVAVHRVAAQQVRRHEFSYSMTLMKTRSYSSPRREAEAAATRASVVDAAARLFVRDGYAATPMKSIATEAGVSLPTVHLHGPKHALLIAAFERAFAGDEGRHPLTERPVMVEIIAEPDVDVAMTKYVSFLAGANERAAAITRALTAAASADEGARAAYLDLDARRQRDMRLAADVLAQRGLIAAERIQWAADVLGYLTGPDAYLHLVAACGWSRAEYEEWLHEGLHHLVEKGRS